MTSKKHEEMRSEAEAAAEAYARAARASAVAGSVAAEASRAALDAAAAYRAAEADEAAAANAGEAISRTPMLKEVEQTLIHAREDLIELGAEEAHSGILIEIRRALARIKAVL